MTIAARGRVFHVAPEDTFTIGRVQGRFDIAFELERAYAFEAQALVDPTATPATDVQTDTESSRNRDVLVAVSIARAAETSLKPEHLPARETKFRFNALHSREVRRTSAWALLAPSVAASAAVLAAVFITIHGHQEASTSQPAAIERGRAADIEPAVDRPRIPVLTEVLAAPRDIQVPVGVEDIKAPDGRSAIPVPARPTKSIPSARRMQRSEKVKMAAHVPNDWKTEMLHEIEACRAESFLARIACVEQVRWKHCAQDRWNTVAACAAGTHG